MSWWLSGGVSAVNCLGAYAAKGAASLAASYSNLNAPGTNDLIAVTAPAGGWDATNGWKFTNALAGGCLQAATVGDGHTFLMRFSNAAAANAFMTTSADNYWRIRQRAGGTDVQYYYKTTTGVVTVPPYMASGNYGMAAGQGYRNGAAEGLPSTGTSVINAAMYIGAATWPAAMYVQAYALYNTALSAAQMLAISTAMAAL